MPTLLDLLTNVENNRYYSGYGTFDANKKSFGDNGPYIQTKESDTYAKAIKSDSTGYLSRVVGAGVDTLRISKFLTDLKVGPLFLAKQVSLQRMNPAAEQPVSGTPSSFLGRLTNDIQTYNPLGTNLLAQVAGNGVGAHFRRHGLLPVGGESLTREKVVIENDKQGKSQMIEMLKKVSQVNVGSGLVTLRKYSGGPGSFMGVGTTTLPQYYSTFLAADKDNPLNNGFVDKYAFLAIGDYSQTGAKSPFNGEYSAPKDSYIDKMSKVTIEDDPLVKELQVAASNANKFVDIKKDSVFAVASKNTMSEDKKALLQGFTPIPYDNILGIVEEGGQMFIPDPKNTGQKINLRNTDFRAYKKLLDPKAFDGVSILNYTDKTVNIYNRIGIINPGKTSKSFIGVVNNNDRVNMVSLYKATFAPEVGTDINGNPVDKDVIRDLVKFRIKAYSNDRPDKTGVYMIFRAFLTGISDNTDLTLTPIRYVGRGEQFYTPDITTSTISFGFTIQAFSRSEMRPLYQKLNYLKSCMYPDYKANKMRGNIMELTIGDYIKEQPGFFTSLNITIPDDANWEIAMDEPERGNDQDMHELPMTLKVECSFTPTYNFLPKRSSQAPFIGIDDKEGNLKDWTKTIRPDGTYTHTNKKLQ